MSRSDALDRAIALHKAGRLAEATAAYEVLVAAEPRDADAWHLLGVVLHQQGDHVRARPAVDRALALSATVASYHGTQGLVMHALGALAEAETAFRNAIVLAPEEADFHNNLGLLQTERQRLDEAEAAFRRALVLRPDYAGARSNLARTLLRAGKDGEALAHSRAAVAARPDNSGFWVVHGVALQQAACYGEAETAFRRAVALAPDNPDAHVNLAHVLLLGNGGGVPPASPSAGATAAGASRRSEVAWAAYEWRLRRPSHARPFGIPPWDGGSVAGWTVLLWGEQGLGDAIQFLRYAPTLAARGARVLVLCDRALRRLFAAAAGVDAVVTGQVAADLQAPMMSLPYLLSRHGLPPAVEFPYLASPPAAQLDAGAGAGSLLKVGLVWAGNPGHANDRRRSVRPEALAPLTAVRGVRFFSLQTGPTATQTLPGVTPVGQHFADFADTAAAVAALDLLVSVDTSVAHLAGAMGRPVWLLLPHVPDWRWGLQAETTAWYPTMKLYRQDADRAWGPVIARVARDLAVFAAQGQD